MGSQRADIGYAAPMRSHDGLFFLGLGGHGLAWLVFVSCFCVFEPWPWPYSPLLVLLNGRSHGVNLRRRSSLFPSPVVLFAFVHVRLYGSTVISHDYYLD